MAKHKVLDLRPIQIGLVPPSFHDHPLVLNPIIRIIIVKLYSYFISAQMIFGAIIIDRMIVIFGPNNDLYRRGTKLARIDVDIKDGVRIACSARPRVRANKG